MKVAYFHGLESKQGGPKVDFLQTCFEEVYAPRMDYRNNANLFQEQLEFLKEYKADLVIGSSFGGYFAYHIAAQIACPKSILLNPALAYRSFEINMQECNVNSTVHELHLGRYDELINYKDTLKWCLEHNADNCSFYIKDYGHRTAYEDFVQIVEQYLSR